MINLAFKYSNFLRMKYIDILFYNLLKKEKTNFENIIKNEIIHNILVIKNLIEKETCEVLYQRYTYFNKNLDINVVNNLLKENCDIMYLSNNIKKFYLKKEAFKYCDIDYIMNESNKEIVINYILDLKKYDINILNTYIAPSLIIQEKLNNKKYETFFSKKNLENILDFYNVIISNEKYQLITAIFYLSISKMICTYLKIFNPEKINNEFKIKLLQIIDNKKLKANEESFQYIRKLLREENIINENKKQIFEKRKNLKEKDNQKNLSIIPTESDFNLKENNCNVQINEICIYCKKRLIK